MTTDTPNLNCSFCGKSKDEVTKIIAGPSAYICDECVATCNDILSDMHDRPALLHGQTDSLERQSRIQHYLARTKMELDGARLLVEKGQLRLGVIAARESARSAVRALEFVRGPGGVGSTIDNVLSAAIADDADLRLLGERHVTTVVTQHYFTRDADEDDAANAVATASGIVAYVERQLNAA
jgi:hypothetical protein